MVKKLLRRFLLWLAGVLYDLEYKMPHPSDWASSIYSWLERHHLCCTRHGYSEDI